MYSVHAMNAHEKDTEIILTLLQSIEERRDVTQRSLAKRLGLALGLTNNYLKFCIRNGLIKVEKIPANRYYYYLTPKGIAKKGKLMGVCLRHSMKLFRETHHECIRMFEHFAVNKFHEVAIIGDNELSDVAYLVSKSYEVSLTVLNAPVKETEQYDAWIVAEIENGQLYYDQIVKIAEGAPVFCFSSLKVRPREYQEVEIGE